MCIVSKVVLSQSSTSMATQRLLQGWYSFKWIWEVGALLRDYGGHLYICRLRTEPEVEIHVQTKEGICSLQETCSELPTGG